MVLYIIIGVIVLVALYVLIQYNSFVKLRNMVKEAFSTMDVYFTGYNKHGIFRKIPLRNTVTRLNGTKSNNRAEISNISVSDSYTTSTQNGYKVLKIGSSSKTVSGKKTYKIKYNYNIGKDPLKNADELYFNLIGDGWDTDIKNF